MNVQTTWAFPQLAARALKSIGVGSGRAGKATVLPIFSRIPPFLTTGCWSETKEKRQAATVAKIDP